MTLCIDRRRDCGSSRRESSVKRALHPGAPDPLRDERNARCRIVVTCLALSPRASRQHSGARIDFAYNARAGDDVSTPTMVSVAANQFPEGDLCMKSRVLNALVALAAMLPVSGQAAEFGYSFIDFAVIPEADVDGRVDVDGDGFQLRGSLAVTNTF